MSDKIKKLTDLTESIAKLAMTSDGLDDGSKALISTLLEAYKESAEEKEMPAVPVAEEKKSEDMKKEEEKEEEKKSEDMKKEENITKVSSEEEDLLKSAYIAKFASLTGLNGDDVFVNSLQDALYGYSLPEVKDFVKSVEANISTKKSSVEEILTGDKRDALINYIAASLNISDIESYNRLYKVASVLPFDTLKESAEAFELNQETFENYEKPVALETMVSTSAEGEKETESTEEETPNENSVDDSTPAETETTEGETTGDEEKTEETKVAHSIFTYLDADGMEWKFSSEVESGEVQAEIEAVEMKFSEETEEEKKEEEKEEEVTEKKSEDSVKEEEKKSEEVKAQVVEEPKKAGYEVNWNSFLKSDPVQTINSALGISPQEQIIKTSFAAGQEGTVDKVAVPLESQSYDKDPRKTQVDGSNKNVLNGAGENYLKGSDKADEYLSAVDRRSSYAVNDPKALGQFMDMNDMVWGAVSKTLGGANVNTSDAYYKKITEEGAAPSYAIPSKTSGEKVDEVSVLTDMITKNLINR